MNRIVERLEKQKEEIETIKSKNDLPYDIIAKFYKDKASKKYLGVYDKKEPLVSVCIGTYNRAQLLIERSLKSILNQTYSNLEVIVVGDHCTDETESKMAKVKDTRVKFVNLPQRGKYPQNPDFRWMVAGTATVNYALNIAKGDFITHLDDDDEHLPDRITKLLMFIQNTQADLVFHPFFREDEKGRWHVNNAKEFKVGSVSTSSIFYHKWFCKIQWDINAYKYHEPGDWNRLRKIKYLNAKIERYPDILLKHYMQRTQINK